MKLYEMSTFVASCRTLDGALELARFMEKKFPLDEKIHGSQLHRFVAVVQTDGRVTVHSVVPVNELGKEYFKKCVAEFLEIKQVRKPIQAQRPAATQGRKSA